MAPVITPTVVGLDVGIKAPNYRLPANAHVGRVRLAVSNLAASVHFYSVVIGLHVRSNSGGLAQLGIKGSSEVLLEVEELPGVQAISRRTRLGLYHTAFLLPSRQSLSSFIQHLIAVGVPFGSSDHLYSEALYLTDPDGLSVEIYADRPTNEWTVEGPEIVSGVDPLRFNELPTVEKRSWTGVPAGTTMGHVHLYVGDLDEAKSFYHHAMGLDLMTWRYPGALFTSAGGYHHHVGLNVWAAGSPRASETDARMLFWELVLPTEPDVEAVKASFARAGYELSATVTGEPSLVDPWGIRVVLVTESNR